MGTSGAYGGTPSWRGVRQRTQQWIGGSGSSGGEGGPGPNPAPSGPTPPPSPATAPSGAPASPPAASATGGVSPAMAALIRSLGTRLTTPGSGRSSSSAGQGLTSGGGSRGGGGRSYARASRAGARATSGVYGLRTASTEILAEIGLTLEDLTNLSESQQAQRIVDAAIGPTGSIDGSELRMVNSEVVLWALLQETAPAPSELVERWVVEYVWRSWITECGTQMQKLVNGKDRLRFELEMRAVLEAVVTAQGLPINRPLVTEDFQTAIQSALGSLKRIGGIT